MMKLNSFGDTQPTTCSMLSRQVQEQIFGTATRSNVWLLLEYPHPMGAKAFEESNIPEPTKQYLNSIKNSIPGTRIQLIKRPSTHSRDITFFLALTRESLPLLFEFHLDNYEDLPDLNLAAAFSEDGLKEHIRNRPLFLICTNGKRDPCCAQWGLPLYKGLSKINPDSIWQTSHVGGHRFAPNMVCFPHGICYGRADHQRAQILIDAYQQQQILLENFRGRSTYPPEVQAAEYYMRKKTGNLSIDAFKLKNVEEFDDNRWLVHFVSQSNNQLHRLEISLEQLNFEIFESCRKPDNKVFAKEYCLVRYEAD
jgi:hypothetical protein